MSKTSRKNKEQEILKIKTIMYENMCKNDRKNGPKAYTKPGSGKQY